MIPSAPVGAQDCAPESATAQTFRPETGPSAPPAMTVSFAGCGPRVGTTTGGGAVQATATSATASHFTAVLRMAVTRRPRIVVGVWPTPLDVHLATVHVESEAHLLASQVAERLRP